MKAIHQTSFAFIAAMILTVVGLSAQDEKSTAAAQAENSNEIVSPEEQKYIDMLSKIDWEKSSEGKVGTHATLKVPEDYLYTGGRGTVTLLEYNGNLTSGQELGYITPKDFSWFAIFEFENCGYVKDDDKDSLDADKILEQMQIGQTDANKRLKQVGKPTLELVGWHTKPFYNPDTKNLEWAIRLRSEDGSESINYKTKLLGRRGVMDVVLVCNEGQMATVVPDYQKILAGYQFVSDQSYAAFTKGDKIAEYGLTGLIVGGGLLAAAKSGLLVKLWKPIAIGAIALFAFIKRIFGRKTQA
jgi:uncharacterized membrane-anchored protein